MLNLSEQLKVQNDQLSPTAVKEKLEELSQASATKWATDFVINQKPVDPLADALAGSYVQKMMRVVSAVLGSNQGGTKALNNAMAAYIAKKDIATPELIEGLSQAQWEGFISENIDEAMEAFAGILVTEKTAYENYQPA